MRRTGDEEVPLEVPVAVGRRTRVRVVLFVMSARDQMTKMLDQLMGQNRDGEFCKKIIYPEEPRPCP